VLCENDSALGSIARSRFDKIFIPTPRYVAQRGVNSELCSIESLRKELLNNFFRLF
jgi:hypothetical protein